jgi:hypothetical protein
MAEEIERLLSVSTASAKRANLFLSLFTLADSGK